METADLERLRRNSITSAVLTLFSGLLVLGALVFSYDSIKSSQEKVNALEERQGELKREIEASQVKIESQLLEIMALEKKYSPQAITAKSYSVILNGIFDAEKRQIFDWGLWVEVPITIRGNVEKVVYEFPHRSMINKARESDLAENSYAVAYRGWGCLSNIKITVQMKEGDDFVMGYNNCSGVQTNL